MQLEVLIMVYQGSKARYAKSIVPILQETINVTRTDTFIDACCGGCNIIQDIECKNKIAIDINGDLIELYKYSVGAYKNGDMDAAFPVKLTRADWNKAKQGLCEPWFRALVCFFASYSARGFSGGYCLNVKRDFYNERLKNFKAQLPKLNDVEFVCGDVNNIDCSNAVIYVDPPYRNTKRYDANKNFNYDEFWESIRRLSKNNKVFVSEQIAPNDFCSVWCEDVKRNCFGSMPKTARESLWTLDRSDVI